MSGRDAYSKLYFRPTNLFNVSKKRHMATSFKRIRYRKYFVLSEEAYCRYRYVTVLVSLPERYSYRYGDDM